MPAVALTDTGNLFAALEFSEAAAKAGRSSRSSAASSRSPTPTPAHPGDRPPAPRPVVLLAQDETGFGNLMKLSSLNYLDCGAAEPHVTLDALDAHADGLICLTGGADGPLGALIARRPRRRAPGRSPSGSPRSSPAGSTSRSSATRSNGAPRTAGRGGDRARPRRPRLRPRPAAGRHQRRALRRAARLYDAHDALLCIADGAYVDQQEPRRRLTPEHCFKSPGRDGRALRRPARGGREHRRDRPPLRLPRRRSASRSCRASPRTRSRSCAARPATASTPGSR